MSLYGPLQDYISARFGFFFHLKKHFNVYIPIKVSNIPAFISKNNSYVSFGLMGGAMQPQGHAQIVLHSLKFFQIL